MSDSALQKLTKDELKLIASLGYIPNDLLDRYLVDKITVRPSYADAAVDKSRYEEMRQAMKTRSKTDDKSKKKGK